MTGTDSAGEGKGASPWNSLEIAKLIISLATPVMVFLLGLQLKLSDHDTAEKNRADDIRRAELIRKSDKHEAELAQQLETSRVQYQQMEEDRRAETQREFERRRQQELDDQRYSDVRMTGLIPLTRLILSRESIIRETTATMVANAPKAAAGPGPKVPAELAAELGKYDAQNSSWGADIRVDFVNSSRGTSTSFGNAVETSLLKGMPEMDDVIMNCAKRLQNPKAATRGPVFDCTSDNWSGRIYDCDDAVISDLQNLAAKSKVELDRSVPSSVEACDAHSDMEVVGRPPRTARLHRRTHERASPGVRSHS